MSSSLLESPNLVKSQFINTFFMFPCSKKRSSRLYLDIICVTLIEANHTACIYQFLRLKPHKLYCTLLHSQHFTCCLLKRIPFINGFWQVSFVETKNYGSEIPSHPALKLRPIQIGLLAHAIKGRKLKENISFLGKKTKV